MKKILLLAAAIFYSAILFAQTFEIRAVNKGAGIVGVEIRLATGSNLTTGNNLFTDITFAIKWDSSYRVNLLENVTTTYNIRKAGERQVKNLKHFQIFYAEPTPFALPVTFAAGQWKEILTVGNTRHGAVPFGTFQIVEPNFDITTDPNVGIGFLSTSTISYYTPSITASATGVILPVKLTRFEAIPVNKTIELQWTTEGEYNNKGFEIERSDASASNFKKIEWVASKGNGNNTQEYSFVDRNVAGKIKYYYRLKQVDVNDNFLHSETKSATLKGFDNEAIQLMPNPAGNVLQVVFSGIIETGEINLRIIDTKGSKVLQKKGFMEPGKMINIDVSNLLQGQYFMVIEKENQLLYSKAFQKR